MDNEEKNTPMESAEDLAAEKEHLADIKEDKIREDVIKEYGFDAEEDKDRIEKLVKREMGHRKNLSKAVGQKVKYREGLAKANPPSEDKDKGKEPPTVSGEVAKELDRRDLEEMAYPDEIKAAIKRVAQLDNVSVRKAEKDPTVQARIEAWKKETGADDAAISGRDDRSGSGKGASDSDMTPPKVDMSTPEGRKTYDEWKAKQKAAGN